MINFLCTSTKITIRWIASEVNYLNEDDKTLVRLITNDDPKALSALYDRYKILVYSLAANIVGIREAAEEITLDVFRQVWEKADMYHSEKATVKRWLMSITRYRSIDILRRRRHRLDPHSPLWSDSSPETLAAHDNPEEALELAMIRQKVTGAISKLPDEQKETLALAYFKGYTHNQIAEMLNEPLGTIKTRIRLAIQKLRQELRGSENMK